MSHQPQRNEKDCLNCGATVTGHFCHVCGQENIIPKQHFGSLAKHFIYDIFHFDGKFFATLGSLFSRPGFVAKEYASGKRQRYLDPIRMYLFTSAVFFLVFFKVITPEVQIGKNENKRQETGMTHPVVNAHKEAVASPDDSVALQFVQLLSDSTRPIPAAQRNVNVVTIGKRKYTTLASYDSSELALSPSERDSWVKRTLTRRILRVRDKYDYNYGEIMKSLSEIFLHRIPYLLFISLPFFALLLKLLYIRRKDMYYSDHAAFTLYHFIFSFILLLVIFSFNALQNWLQWDVFGWLIVACVIFGAWYLLRSIRVFYGSSRGRAIANTLMLGVVNTAFLLVLFLVFILFSFFEL